MQLESHATPTAESPEQRYASIHRAIERGLESDELWKDLALVSHQLGHTDEALRCLSRIVNPTVLKTVESRLQRAGLVLAKSHGKAVRARRANKASGVEDKVQTHTLGDHVIDAFQYLFHQHMPLLVLVTTLAFPLVVGAGGILTGGGSWLLLAAIAALPGLCVMTIVGAMGRQILIASSEGTGDVPQLPAFAQLVADARRFVVDGLAVLGPLLGPGVLAIILGAPLVTSLPGLLIGAFFVPLAWALRQLRGDMGALSPVRLLRGVTRGGGSYAGLAGVVCLLFVPGALVCWFTLGRPVWVQIAATGPLCVAPLFVASRLLGTWLDSMKDELGNVMSLGTSVATATPVTAPPAQAAPTATGPSKPGFRRRPTKAEQRATPPPVTTRRKPVTRVPGQPAPVAKEIAGREPQRPISDDTPDLSNMPGAIVVSGKDRERSGAAAPSGPTE